MSFASFAMMMPVPEPSSRIAKGFGTPSASRSVHGVGSEELGQAFSLRLRFKSPGSGDRVNNDCRRAENGLGGSNSIPGSSDSK